MKRDKPRGSVKFPSLDQLETLKTPSDLAAGDRCAGQSCCLGWICHNRKEEKREKDRERERRKDNRGDRRLLALGVWSPVNDKEEV